jgi:hypothetical protein
LRRRISRLRRGWWSRLATILSARIWSAGIWSGRSVRWLILLRGLFRDIRREWILLRGFLVRGRRLLILLLAL